MMKVKAISIISETIQKNDMLPIKYDDTNISIDTQYIRELSERTRQRLTLQEISKQQNIENVVGKAYISLENTENISSEPVDKDWMIRFFNNVEDISNDDLQNIWSQILAGEIKRPNTNSLRTLEKLKNITPKEAQIFKNLFPYVIQQGNRFFIVRDSDLNDKYGIKYDTIITMDECGLINSNASLTITLPVYSEKLQHIYNKDLVGIISSKEKQEIVVPVYVLTEAGNQIYKAINENSTNKNYFLDSLETVKSKNDSSINIEIHDMIKINENDIEYNKEIIKII